LSERWQRLLADFEAAAAMGEEERRAFVDARRAEDPAGAAELERWIRLNGWWYSDEEEDADLDRTLDLGDEIVDRDAIGNGDLGALGRIVDRCHHAVELVEPFLDSGRARGAGHPADVEIDIGRDG
jgi:hypothetical protein